MSNPWFNDEQMGGHTDRPSSPPPAEAPLDKLMNNLDDAAEAFWTEEDYDAGDHEKLKAARAALREYVSANTLNPREAELLLLAEPGRPVPPRLLDKLRRISGGPK